MRNCSSSSLRVPSSSSVPLSRSSIMALSGGIAPKLRAASRVRKGASAGGDAQLRPLHLAGGDHVAHLALPAAQPRAAGLDLDEHDATHLPVGQAVEYDQIHGCAKKAHVLGVVAELGEVRDELLVHF